MSHYKWQIKFTIGMMYLCEILFSIAWKLGNFYQTYKLEMLLN